MTASCPPRLLFVSNALDDATRLERGITTDSPAASRKIFMLLRALRHARLAAHALSLGRGRRDGSGRFFASRLRRTGGVAAVYMPFYNRPVLSELLSLVAPVATLWRLRRSAARTTLLFYNRDRLYVPTLLVGAMLGYRMAIDLEDGEVGSGRIARLRHRLFDRLCTNGALLACTALQEWTTVRPALCYYGVIETPPRVPDWQTPAVHFLMGGTLIHETGSDLLVEAVRRLRAEQPAWAAAVAIHVTGKGDGLADFVALAASNAPPRLVVHGRTTDAEYAAILHQCHVGLALKLGGGALANTTFPSKVTEIAGSGLLVLSTDISDVRLLLGDGAFYLTKDDPAELVARIRSIVENRAVAAAAAERGAARIAEICKPGAAGARVRRHLLGEAT